VKARAKVLQGLVDNGGAGDLHVIDVVFDPAKAVREPDPEKRHWLESDLTELRDAAHDIANAMAAAHERLSRIKTALSARLRAEADRGRRKRDKQRDELAAAGPADQYRE